MGWDVSAAIKGLTEGIVAPVTNAYNKNQDRKQAKETMKSQIQLAKQNGEQTVAIRVSDWENSKADQESETWKDEYVTLVYTAPTVQMIIGGIWAAFTGDTVIIDGTIKGIEALNKIGVPMGEIIYVVSLAAVSVNVMAGIKRKLF